MLTEKAIWLENVPFSSIDGAIGGQNCSVYFVESMFVIFPTSSHHRGTRSAQRACRQAKDKLFEPPQGGELFVF